jgi:quercetin dioxygenase-like cupin family protein
MQETYNPLDVMINVYFLRVLNGDQEIIEMVYGLGEKMKIRKNNVQHSEQGTDEYFTGRVRIEPLFQAPDPGRVQIASVTFEPGARTAWHSHPYGQTLIVTSGCGRAQSWDGPIEEIQPGDVVWIPPNEKHWHGAAPASAMTHLSIIEQLASEAPSWMEKVSEEQYQA